MTFDRDYGAPSGHDLWWTTVPGTTDRAASQGVLNMVDWTLRMVKHYNTYNAQTTLGMQSISVCSVNQPFLAIPKLDVAGSQTYGLSRLRAEGTVLGHIDQSSTPGSTKPLISVECTGYNMVEEVINFHANVPRPDRGPGLTGMGFVVYTAVGGVRGTFHVHPEQGLFYPDGSVREGQMRHVLALRSLALAQGWSPVSSYPVPVQGSLSSFGAVADPFLEDGDFFPQVLAALEADYKQWQMASPYPGPNPGGFVRSPLLDSGATFPEWDVSVTANTTHAMLRTAREILRYARVIDLQMVFDVEDRHALPAHRYEQYIDQDVQYPHNRFDNLGPGNIVLEIDELEVLDDALYVDLVTELNDTTETSFGETKDLLELVRNILAPRLLRVTKDRSGADITTLSPPIDVIKEVGLYGVTGPEAIIR